MKALEIAALHRGVVRTSRYRPLRNQWTALVREGRMIRALPGILIDTALAEDWRTWLRAAHLWNPSIVVRGAAAAALTFASDTDVNTV